MSTLFLSHASADDALADQLLEWLEECGFEDCFADHRSIRGGDKWAEELRKAQGICRVVICLLTNSWLRSEECHAEFLAAWYQGKRIIPLLAYEELLAEPAIRARLHRVLAEDQGVDLRSALIDRHLDLDRLAAIGAPLLEGLRAGGALAEVGLDPNAFSVDPHSRSGPYPGLSSFDDTDEAAAVFYGRSHAIARSLEDLRELRASGNRLAYAMIGPSGSGKSSLMRAGVVPRLRRENSWIVPRVFRPGADPLWNFASALTNTLQWYGDADMAENLYTQIVAAANTRNDWVDDASAHREASTAALLACLRKLCARLQERAGKPLATILLVVDQAEELVNQGSPSASILLRCLQLLCRLEAEEIVPGSGAIVPVMLAMTIRTEALSQVQNSALFETLTFRCCDVRPVPRHRFSETIEGPAKRFALDLDGELVDALIVDTPGDECMPLLAFALQRLSERSKDGHMGLVEYERLGKLEGMIEDAAERAVRGIRPGEDVPMKALGDVSDRTAGRVIVPRLVQVVEAGLVYRQVASLDKFSQEELEILRPFVEWRLLVQRGGGPGDPMTIEFAHEAIIRVWPRLHQWIEPQRERLQTLQELVASAQRWQRAGLADSRLMHQGRRLAAVGSLLREPGVLASLDEGGVVREYVRAARRVERRRRIRTVGIVAPVAVSLGIFAAILSDQRAAQKALEAAAHAQMADGSQMMGGAFALAASALSNEFLGHYASDSSDQLVRASGLRFPVLLSIPDQTEAAMSRITAKGDRVVTSSSHDGGAIWDVDRGTALANLAIDGRRANVNFVLSEDGTRLVTRGTDNSFMLWDTASGRTLHAAPAGSLSSGGLLFAAKSGRLITLSPTGDCELWNLATGVALGRLGLQNDVGQVVAIDASSRAIIRNRRDKAELWRLDTGQKIRDLTDDFGYVEGIYDVNASNILVAIPRTGGASAFDMSTGKLIYRLADVGILENGKTAADGKHFITRASDKSLIAWDLKDGTRLGSLGVVADGGSYDFVSETTVFIQRPDNGGVLVDLAGRALLTMATSELEAFASSRASHRLATLDSRGAATLWNSVTGHSIAFMATGGVRRIAFSSDGLRVALSSESEAGALWNADEGKRIVGFHGSEFEGLFTPDGRRYITSSRNNDAQLWDAITGRALGLIAGEGIGALIRTSQDGSRVLLQSVGDSMSVLNIKEMPADSSGAALRELACETNRNVVPIFDTRLRSDKADESVGRYLRGRPWNPCDWRGLGSWSGWRQLARYWAVKYEFMADYRCDEGVLSTRQAAQELACRSASAGPASNKRR